MALRYTSTQLLSLYHHAPPSLDKLATLKQLCLLRRRPYVHRGTRRKFVLHFTAENNIPSIWSERSSRHSGYKHNICTRHLCTGPTNHYNLRSVPASPTRTPQQNPLKTALFNTRSLNNKSLLLHEFIMDKELDLLCLTETWHKPMDYIALNQTTPPGYFYLDNPRPDRRGGGIAVIYHNKLNLRPISIPTSSSFEHLVFRLPGSQSLIVAILYRPPKTCSSFLSDFTDFFTQLSSISPFILVLGDFNIHIDCPKSKFTADFLDILNCLNLTQHVSSPTHTRTYSRPCLLLSLTLSP